MGLISSMDKDGATSIRKTNMGFIPIKDARKTHVVSPFYYVDKIRAMSPINIEQKCGIESILWSEEIWIFLAY